MDDGDLVIVGKKPATKEPIDPADADHAEAVKLSGPERPHARRPDHLHALGQREQDLLVPDRWNVAEMPVDNADAAIASLDGAKHGSHRRRSEAADARGNRFAVQRRPNEEAALHGRFASNACMRGPGVYPSFAIAPSAPGMVT